MWFDHGFNSEIPGRADLRNDVEGTTLRVHVAYLSIESLCADSGAKSHNTPI